MISKNNRIRITTITTICMFVAAVLSNYLFLDLPSRLIEIYFFVTMTVIGIILGLIINLYNQNRYLNPIKQLQEGIEYIITKQDPEASIAINDLYYLTELGNSINRMLEVLKNEQNELKESEEKYKYLSFYDPLTGLYNRTYFEYEMKRISQSPRGFLPLSIISVDIDGHKIVNDTFGHQAGDRQLKYAAEVLKTSIRKEDTLVRAGGDEFCIILPNMPNSVAQQRKIDILDAVEQHNSKNPFIPLSVSVGVATNDYKNKDETVYDIYHRADDDMYYHKYNKDIYNTGRVTEFFLSALAERDYIAQGHADRLTVWAEKMSARLSLEEKTKSGLLLLAKLHDVGNIGIPEEILFKKGELTTEEKNKVRTHVNIGYSIASRSGEVSHIAELILHHHEWWNGKGYPSGLKETEIPLACRIISILDAYDTMTNERLHHMPMDKEDALKELARCSGTQFDPELIEIFIDINQEGNI